MVVVEYHYFLGHPPYMHIASNVLFTLQLSHHYTSEYDGDTVDGQNPARTKDQG